MHVRSRNLQPRVLWVACILLVVLTDLLFVARHDRPVSAGAAERPAVIHHSPMGLDDLFGPDFGAVLHQLHVTAITGWVAAVQHTHVVRWNAAVAVFRAQQAQAARQRQYEAQHRTVSSSQPSVTSSSAPPSVSYGGLSGVVQCIKNHESGNYSEHSHPGSGSGAYQWIPSSWQSWSSRAGYSGYSVAYLAPASVQDAVTMFALTHGGAGNWSDRWGNDPCTSGLPGGG